MAPAGVVGAVVVAGVGIGGGDGEGVLRWRSLAMSEAGTNWTQRRLWNGCGGFGTLAAGLERRRRGSGGGFGGRPRLCNGDEGFVTPAAALQRRGTPL